MSPVLDALTAFVQGFLRSRLTLQVEILTLRHQLSVCQRTCHRPRLKPADQLLWSWLSRAWSRSGAIARRHIYGCGQLMDRDELPQSLAVRRGGITARPQRQPGLRWGGLQIRRRGGTQ
jgi:hypothetical protein